jgi:anthranilate synthase/aminodeoxychorismate synthase-like glutamine amidotransferase
MILLIDNYDSFTYNLAQMLGVAGADVVVRRSDAVDADAFDELAPRAVVVSPGPSHPDAASSAAAIVRHAVSRGIPVLGVCLGHQIIARVFGAEVGRAPMCVHGKTSRVDHDGLGVFRHLPSPTVVGRYHSLAIAEDTLPDDMMVTARSDDGVVMGIRHTQLPVEGVQFHPESILTADGLIMLTNFVGGLRAIQ